MRRLALALLLLSGCDQQQNKSDLELAMRDSDRAVEIEQLKAEIEALKQKDEQQDADAAAINDSLNSLRGTVNSNVDIDNKRHNAIVQQLGTLNCRAGIYCAPQ